MSAAPSPEARAAVPRSFWSTSSSSETSLTAMLMDELFPIRTILGVMGLPEEERIPSRSRLVTSSMAAFEGAQTRILRAEGVSSGRAGPVPGARILVAGSTRSDRNLPTSPQMVLVFPVPGGLQTGGKG